MRFSSRARSAIVPVMHPCFAFAIRLAEVGLLSCAGWVGAAEDRFPFVIPGDDASSTFTRMA